MALANVSRGVVGLYAIAAALIAANWFIYIFAVNAGFIVETSLGYYITPLVNVLFGVVVFRGHAAGAMGGDRDGDGWRRAADLRRTVRRRGSRSGWPRRSAAMAWRKRRRRSTRSKG